MIIVTLLTNCCSPTIQTYRQVLQPKSAAPDIHCAVDRPNFKYIQLLNLSIFQSNTETIAETCLTGVSNGWGRCSLLSEWL